MTWPEAVVYSVGCISAAFAFVGALYMMGKFG